MLNIEDLPSLKNIAKMILSEGSAGQLIIFCIPTENIWIEWKELLITALNNRLNEKNQKQIWGLHTADRNSNTPKEDLANFLSLGNYAGLDEILASSGTDSPIAIELLCKGNLKKPWQDFINKVARFFRISDSFNTNRVICIFAISPSLYPPIQVDAGMRCYGFWNPLRWEELRLIVADSFSENENVMSRAWRISTFTGAANSDPNLVNLLSRKSPRSLSDVKKEILSSRKDNDHIDNNASIENKFYEEKNWDVPSGLTKKWLSGDIIGSTLDRGSVIPWQNISYDNFDNIFSRIVWREQVAGLYPLLMEITYFTSEIITKIKGEKWKIYLNSDDNIGSETEPGVILSIFEEHNLGRLPDKIFKLLHKLRIVRNKLAHLKPVDLKDVNQIWNLFDKFYDS
jgi:hypothetical protein